MQLTSIKTLDIQCNMCERSKKRHLYLQHLTTANLIEMRLICRCHDSRSLIPFQIFTSPSMTSVKSLSWEASTFNLLTDSQSALTKSVRFLPQVNDLSCDSFTLWACASLFREGAITRLRCSGPVAGLSDLLLDKPACLVSLHAFQLHEMIPIILQDSSPYRKIQIMEGFQFSIRQVSL